MSRLIVITGIALLLPLGHVFAAGDPFQPPGKTTVTRATTSSSQTTGTSPAYKLSAILISQGTRSAIINGKRLQTGDRIGRAQLVSVHASHVTLKIGAKHRRLSLFPMKIKTPVETPSHE